MIPSDSFKPAPMTSNEERRLEALKKLGVIGTDQGDIFEIYSELALEVSGFFAASCSLIDVDTQHGISLCSLNGELEKMTEGKPFKGERAQSPCAYTILTPEPLLVPDCREHEIFKEAGAVKAGMIVAYAGFPIINKDNYSLGVLCLLHSDVLNLNQDKIEILKRLMTRLAQQLDTQTEQKEITAQKVVNSVQLFQDTIPDTNINEFLTFCNICSGLNIELEKAKHLERLGYIVKNKSGFSELTAAGQKLQEKMGLKTKTFNKVKIQGDEANIMIDNMMNQLENL